MAAPRPATGTGVIRFVKVRSPPPVFTAGCPPPLYQMTCTGAAEAVLVPSPSCP